MGARSAIRGLPLGGPARGRRRTDVPGDRRHDGLSHWDGDVTHQPGSSDARTLAPRTTEPRCTCPPELGGTSAVIHTMDCKTFREALDCYVDGELSAEARTAAETHRRECARCAR